MAQYMKEGGKCSIIAKTEESKAENSRCIEDFSHAQSYLKCFHTTGLSQLREVFHYVSRVFKLIG